MPKYIGLFNWTDAGVRAAKDTVDRYEAARAMVASVGGSIESIHWTIGPYDLVAVVDAPDDETLSAVMLALASAGNLRGTTMRAFTKDEMASVVAKMP